MNKSIERVAPRVKDLMSIIQDKNTRVVVQKNGVALDVNEIAECRDWYVVNLGLTTEEGEVALLFDISDRAELIYIPFIP